ncbi:MAG: AAA family ATPase [bacterium]|nr:AAA family ATPase [bacterium]
MHLSRLDINGFKSFGERTVLEFAPGVTGIVGPNGSGKSNVVDAIRWSLGEQGYKGIRLEKSDDVIFLGSAHSTGSGQGGKGKMSRASVEMVFNDIPPDKGVAYEQLIVARNVYRDGEGEYFMNKAQVRLKDVLETLARLSVSTKNYSIVTQGMSDQLLRFTPQELRSTVEDASGVKEWQMKKRDAERKLERSAEHAMQVQALLAELRPYLNSLRNQMKRWERRDEYMRRVQELKEQKIYVRAKDLVARKASYDARRNVLQETLRTRQREKELLIVEINEAEAALGKEGKKEHVGHDEALQALYERRMGLERELIKIESQLAAFRAERKGAPDARHLQVKISELRAMLEAAFAEPDVDRLKEGVGRTLEAARNIEKLFAVSPADVPLEIRTRQTELKEAIGAVEKELDGLKRQGRDAYAKEAALKETLFHKERLLRKTEDDIDRALTQEAALMEEYGRFAEEERQIMHEAGEAMPDAPDASDKVLRVLEVSHGGKILPSLGVIEEELIRATTRLQDIGDVDPQVKAEFDKTEGRFLFLSKELEDVDGARKDMEKLIMELDEEIRKRFEDAFVNVNEEFSKYMQTIFGGGKGELLKIMPQRKKHADDDLEDAEDETEPEQEKEGIVVHVELPGKRIKSLELLSGGERSLTSLAFLFALIATVKPPFVVLDEVDAALDEANSRRFANLLESVKSQTQCIVVTHNRSTMSAASALYGVTMGGDGISRILSLKLEK